MTTASGVALRSIGPNGDLIERNADENVTAVTASETRKLGQRPSLSGRPNNVERGIAIPDCLAHIVASRCELIRIR